MSDSGNGQGGANEGTLDPRERYHDPNESDRIKQEAAQPKESTVVPVNTAPVLPLLRNTPRPTPAPVPAEAAPSAK